MKTDFKKIGSIIREARVNNNQTQQSLADECGISRTYLADIESGRNLGGLQVTARLFGVLGLDLNLIKNVVNTDN